VMVWPHANPQNASNAVIKHADLKRIWRSSGDLQFHAKQRDERKVKLAAAWPSHLRYAGNAQRMRRVDPS